MPKTGQKWLFSGDFLAAFGKPRLSRAMSDSMIPRIFVVMKHHKEGDSSPNFESKYSLAFCTFIGTIRVGQASISFCDEKTVPNELAGCIRS